MSGVNTVEYRQHGRVLTGKLYCAISHNLSIDKHYKQTHLFCCSPSDTFAFGGKSFSGDEYEEEIDSQEFDQCTDDEDEEDLTGEESNHDSDEENSEEDKPTPGKQAR